jgi:RNA polymerase sigma-70 factor, ECF subfamily
MKANKDDLRTGAKGGVSPVGGSPAPDLVEPFAAAFETYVPFAWSVLGLLGVPAADVPDVCQEVFLVLHRRWSEIDATRPMKSWLYGVCVRKAAEYRRHHHARLEVATAQPPEGRVEASAEDIVDQRWASRLLAQVLDQLDDNRRAVFVLYEIEDLSLAEVAAAVGCPLQTAWSRLKSARSIVTSAFTRAATAIGAPSGMPRRGP